MPITFIIVGIFTGTVAAALAFSFDLGAVWALLSYALSGASAVLGAALITVIRHNNWPHRFWQAKSGKTGWHARLDQMSQQASGHARVGLFSAVKQNPQVRL